MHAARDLNGFLKANFILVGSARLPASGRGDRRHHDWFDFTTGLIEGWQHFAEPIAPGQSVNCRLSNGRPRSWRAVSTKLPAFPEKDSSATIIGQHVILAHTASTDAETSLHIGGVAYES